MAGKRHGRRRVIVLACSAPALLLPGAAVRAEEPSLPAVTVTAAPAAPPTLESMEQARRRVDAVPGGANIVDAEQYREGRVSTLPDALQFSPGVFAASRFGAEEARVSIRGSGLQRTFHMRGIALLQDGVPLNLADGGADFQAVEPLAARYVEVYRGANALQFGAATLGGAINFVSPSGLSSPPVSARVEGGSFGYKRAQVTASGSSESSDWFIAAAEFFQKGFRAHARQDTQRVSGNLGWTIGGGLETRFFLQAVRTDSELPGALTRAEMAASPRRADPAAVAGDQHRDFDLYRLSNRTTLRLSPERRVEAGAFYAYKHLVHPIFQVLDQNSNDYGVSARFISEERLFGRRNQFVLGTNLVYGELDDDRFRNVGGEAAARTGASRQRSKNLSVFAENQYYLMPATAVVVGAQAVDAGRRLRDRFLADGDQSVDEGYRRISPKFGVRQDIAPGVQVFANASGSYEPPSFGELAGGRNVTPVAAQRATTLEAGTRGTARQAWGSLRWDLALYRARVKDELLALNDAAGNPLGTRNADRTLHQGIELGLQADVGAHWTARIAYQLNDFRFDGDPVYGSNRLAGVPRQFASAEVLYRTAGGLYFGPRVRLASSTWIDHANSLRAGGYGVYDFKLGQKLDKSLSWFLEARNLGDKTYAATTGVVADARGRDSRQFYPGEGRAFYAGVELAY
ncbi:TonB-dependent receptor family protein [Noviherbaspirillum aridicola]|uniref:TonB-dependent receptor n=1 Tax=Noviherbaspirillum aridicola TaxID=2849687 RepID=A0ABQ4Q868_9BURK|nr:TonB-dependent receptor [Noviherbaspirillum aridicola]GIZ53353.1 TonB-dependent receptor [Noviherbaspirillum aridicola]